MTVSSIGSVTEVFKFKLPGASDVELQGVFELDEETLPVLSPFLDMSTLLEPL